MQVEAAELDLPIQQVGEIRPPQRTRRPLPLSVQVAYIAHQAGLAVVGDDQVVPLLGPEDVVADLSTGGIVFDANVIALRHVERVVDDIDARGVDEQADFRVAVDQIPRDELVQRGIDADAVPCDAIELDRTGDGHADVVQLDQVGVVEIVAAEYAGSCNASRVCKDVLALHPRIDERNAGRVVVHVVRREVADESESATVMALTVCPHAQVLS